jgi:hypothetical protein
MPVGGSVLMTPEEREEIKRHFDVVAEGLRSDIRTVGEGVAMNTERLDRLDGDFRAFRDEMYGFRDETRQNFSELRSMIKLSYAELDRRISTLEASYDDLATRLTRVETKLAS